MLFQKLEEKEGKTDTEVGSMQYCYILRIVSMNYTKFVLCISITLTTCCSKYNAFAVNLKIMYL